MKTLWKLVNEEHPHQGVIFGAGNYFIGRRTGSLLNLSDLSISRIHANLQVIQDGEELLIQDSSTFGTFRNDVKLAPKEFTRINSGDRMLFGESSTVFRFVAVPLVVTSASLPADEQAFLLDALASRSISYLPQVVPPVTHLVTGRIKVSHKLLLALASGLFIVTPEWAKHLPPMDSLPLPLEKWPDESLFLPAHPTGRWQPTPERASVFSAYLFIVSERSRFEKVTPFVVATGGLCALAETAADLHQLHDHQTADRTVVSVRPTSGCIPGYLQHLPSTTEAAIMKGMIKAELNPDFWQLTPPGGDAAPNPSSHVEISQPSTVQVESPIDQSLSSRIAEAPSCSTQIEHGSVLRDVRSQAPRPTNPLLLREHPVDSSHLASLTNLPLPAQHHQSVDHLNLLAGQPSLKKPLPLSSSTPSLPSSSFNQIDSSPSNYKKFKRKQVLRQKRFIECSPEKLDFKKSRLD